MSRFAPTRTRLRGAAAACAALAALAVAACGDDEDTTEDFPAQADAACLDIATELAELRSEAGPPDSPESAAELIELQLPVRQEALERVGALEPPAELVASWDDYVAQQEAKVVALEDSLVAARNEDQNAFAEAQERFESASDSGREAAEQAGLEDCAETLPPAGQEDVLAAVEKLMTSADSEQVCGELLTEHFAEAEFGSVEECVKKRGLPTAAALRLLDVGGVASTWAFVDVEVTDVAGKVRQMRVELVYRGDEEKGDWLVDYRVPLEGGKSPQPPEDEAGEKGDEPAGGETAPETTTTPEPTTPEGPSGESP